MVTVVVHANVDVERSISGLLIKYNRDLSNVCMD